MSVRGHEPLALLNVWIHTRQALVERGAQIPETHPLLVVCELAGGECESIWFATLNDVARFINDMAPSGEVIPVVAKGEDPHDVYAAVVGGLMH